MFGGAGDTTGVFGLGTDEGPGMANGAAVGAATLSLDLADNHISIHKWKGKKTTIGNWQRRIRMTVHQRSAKVEHDEQYYLIVCASHADNAPM